MSYLLERRDNGIKPYLLTNFEGIVPHAECFLVKDLEESCHFCISHSIRRIVIDVKQFREDIIKKFSGKLDFYIWAHNIVGECLLNKFLTLSCIKKIICVSQSQMLNYKDHPSFLKSCYIYNIILFKDKEFYKSKTTTRNQHGVVFMGCIRPDKGFHVLAKAWPQVLMRIPDAQLYVIGTGQLYGKNVILGKHGIAAQEYEDLFMPYLTDDSGMILPSVHFMGLLGDEKYDIMGKCKVGVPNPTNSTETFCISGVEMELMGCSVTTLRLPVYMETQMNTRYLFDEESQLSDYLVSRLEDEPDCFDDLYKFVITKFATECSIARWEKLICTNEIEVTSKYSSFIRNIKIIIAKYYFHIFTRSINFIKYRINHHIFKAV